MRHAFDTDHIAAIDNTTRLAFLNFADGWAFSKPVRKVYYHLTITPLSAAVALILEVRPDRGEVVRRHPRLGNLRLSGHAEVPGPIRQRIGPGTQLEGQPTKAAVPFGVPRPVGPS